MFLLVCPLRDQYSKLECDHFPGQKGNIPGKLVIAGKSMERTEMQQKAARLLTCELWEVFSSLAGEKKMLPRVNP